MLGSALSYSGLRNLGWIHVRCSILITKLLSLYSREKIFIHKLENKILTFYHVVLSSPNNMIIISTVSAITFP